MNPSLSAHLATGLTVERHSRLGVRLRSFLRSPWAIALLVLSLHSGWVATYFATGGTAWGFISAGRQNVLRSDKSSVIKLYPGGQYASGFGFDGQFYYFLALDPANARYYIPDDRDRNVDYIYTRAVYPMAARLLALGRADLIPYTLIIVNLLALWFGTLLVGLWLRRKGCSPALALIYGLYPGFWMALIRDCPDAVAFALVALAFYLLDFGPRYRLSLSALCLCLATLTRETIVIFPLVLGLGLLHADWKAKRERWWLRGTSFLALSGGPVALYKAFLWYWLGGPPKIPSGGRLQIIPFHGLFEFWPAQAFDRILAALSLSLPGLICLGVAAWCLWKGVRRIEVWLLAINIWLFVVALNAHSYMVTFGAPRHAAATVFCALLCVPIVDAASGRKRKWLYASATFWLFPMVFYLFATPALMLARSV